MVDLANTASTAGGGMTEKLRSLHELKTAGALTPEEYESEKQKMLAAG
ncbi:MAG: hypothetical protein JWM27_686 [Gemmatimonadetes bacterium]|nr:hypothetical protein [Gemmatimonadota bacterium]